MWPVWSSKKKSGSNSRRNSPLCRPPRNIASSTSMFQSISVRIARSCAGALRAVTSAVRMRMPCAGSCCSRCSASSSGLNGPAASGVSACSRSCAWKASRPLAWKTRSASSENSTASPSKAMRTSLRMRVGGARRMRVDARRRHAGFERRAHVGLVGRQEQVGGERLQVAPGRAAAREDAALRSACRRPAPSGTRACPRPGRCATGSRPRPAAPSASLKASSFCTSENATPGLGRRVERSSCSCM